MPAIVTNKTERNAGVYKNRISETKHQHIQ